MGLWDRRAGTKQKHMTSYLLFQESPKTSQHWREPKPKGNLTYHQYIPPEPRQGYRADPQVEGSPLDPPGPPLWEGTTSQQPPPRYDPHFCSPGSSGRQLPPHPGPKSSGPQSPLPSVLRNPDLLPKSLALSPQFLFSQAWELASRACSLRAP